MPPPMPAKVCIVCGEDCSARPRSKDSAGRYTCKACADAAADRGREAADERGLDLAAVAAAERVAAAVAPMPESAGLCPNCGKYVADNPLCVACGYSRTAGGVIQTRIANPVAPPKPHHERFSFWVSGEALGAALALLTITLGTFGIGFLPAAWAFVGLIGFCAVAFVAMMIVLPFADGEYGWGVFFILAFGASFIGLPFIGFILMVYYIFVVNDRDLLKWVFGSYLVALLILAIHKFHGKTEVAVILERLF